MQPIAAAVNEFSLRLGYGSICAMYDQPFRQEAFSGTGTEALLDLFYGQLGVKFEMLRAVGKRSSDEGLEAWLVIRHVAAPWEPCAKEPLERS